MTERTEKVEAPLARRRVQLTLAVIASAAGLWLLISSWHASPQGQDNRTSGSGERGEAADAAAKTLIRIDLNAAESRELALLPGVGPVLARRIVENRARLGPFCSIDDLSRVHGIGPKTINLIQSICIVDPPVPGQREVPRLASTRGLEEPEGQGSFDHSGR